MDKHIWVVGKIKKMTCQKPENNLTTAFMGEKRGLLPPSPVGAMT